MARLITKFKYLKGKNGNVGGYATYIATREGVDKIDTSFLYGEQTQKQESLIKKILKDFPDSKDMHEYEDYVKEPTKGNASEFITRALEDNAGQAMDKKTYADYIATRPRAERFGSHGLFTDDGVELKLSEVSKELNAFEGNVWTVIISLRREDAERLNFNKGTRWRDMLRTQTENISKNFKIDLENLQWRAAFHNESHHPHVHLMVYSKNPKEGYLTERGVHNLRSAFAKDIFSQDLYCVYDEQMAKRDELKRVSKEQVEEIIRALQQRGMQNGVIEEKLIQLSKRLSNTKGKKIYGYLKAEVKDLVCSIVDELEKDERIKTLYDLWYEQKEKIIQTYTSALPPRLPLSQNPEFKSIKNAVIQAAMGLIIDTEEEIPMPEVEEENTENDIMKKIERLERIENDNSNAQYLLGKIYLNEEEVKDIKKGLGYMGKAIKAGNHYAMCRMGKLYLYGKEVERDKELAMMYFKLAIEHGNEQAEEIIADAKAWEEKTRKENIERGVISLFCSIGRIFYKRLGMDNENRKIRTRTEGKLLEQINKKKRAQGLKQG